MTTATWRKIPFFRWSFWRLAFGTKTLLTEWQVGDGREARLLEHVLAKARKGDAGDAIRVIDEFGWNESFLINVGDEKGLILDGAVARAGAARILELGTYIGYSALRMAVTAPGAKIFSIEFNAANADIAKRIFDHAGVGNRVTVVVGTLGDGGKTVEALNDIHDFKPGSVDLVFVDHAKDAYLPDLKLILEQGWLRPGAIVVADNIKFPGAPDYRAYMTGNEGKRWRTKEYETHLEYQSVIRDLMLVSEFVS